MNEQLKAHVAAYVMAQDKAAASFEQSCFKRDNNKAAHLLTA